MIPFEVWLYLAAFLFCLGVFMVLTRRNAVMALLGIELILNAANLNFVAFAMRDPERFTGRMAALFVIVLAAAEAAVALAIVLNVYKRHKTIQLDELNSLKD
jgi:NADH-quinone oxidoreductase subunit K